MSIRIFSSLCICALTLTLTSCSDILEATRSTPLDDGQDSRLVGSQINDEVIETKGLVNISKASSQLEHAHIVVVSYNGVVLLAGQVPNEAMKELAERTLREIAGVRTVYTVLEIREATTAEVRTVDSWITAKVKTKLATNSLSLLSDVKVVTENGVVYLLGIIRQHEGEQASAIASNTQGVQRVVKLFEYHDN